MNTSCVLHVIHDILGVEYNKQSGYIRLKTLLVNYFNILIVIICNYYYFFLSFLDSHYICSEDFKQIETNLL